MQPSVCLHVRVRGGAREVGTSPRRAHTRAHTRACRYFDHLKALGRERSGLDDLRLSKHVEFCEATITTVRTWPGAALHGRGWMQGGGAGGGGHARQVLRTLHRGNSYNTCAHGRGGLTQGI